jgi:hypothetical protein
LVLIEDAQPYLDGHKVRFLIGNPSSATLAGVKMQLKYGARTPDYPTGDVNSEEFSKALAAYSEKLTQLKAAEKSLDVNEAFTLEGGRWTVVETAIAPSKPEEIGEIQVTLTSNSVILNAAPKGKS